MKTFTDFEKMFIDFFTKVIEFEKSSSKLKQFIHFGKKFIIIYQNKVRMRKRKRKKKKEKSKLGRIVRKKNN